MPAFSTLRAFLAASNLGGAGFDLSGEIEVNPATSSYIIADFDSQNANKFVVGWSESGTFKAKVGTVSGTSISFGSTVTIDTSCNGPIHLQCDPASGNRFFAGYSVGTTHNSGTPRCKIGTISGTTISMGSSISMPAGPGHPNSTWAAAQRGWAWDRTGTYIFMAAYDQSSANQGRAYRITSSGSSLSSWTYIGQMHDNGREHHVTTNLAVDNSAVVSYAENHVASVCRVLTGTSMGSAYTHVSNVGDYQSPMKFIPNSTSKFLIAYADENDSNYGKIRVGTVSGSTISYSTEYTFASYSVYEIWLDISDDDDNTFALTWTKSSADPNGKGALCTVNTSTNVITIGDEETINSSGTCHSLKPTFDINNELITVYRDNTSGAEQYYGRAIVGGI